MTKFVLSCPKATGQIDVDGRGIICKAPPIWKKFIGQHYSNLESWLRHISGGIVVERTTL